MRPDFGALLGSLVRDESLGRKPCRAIRVVILAFIAGMMSAPVIAEYFGETVLYFGDRNEIQSSAQPKEAARDTDQ